MMERLKVGPARFSRGGTLKFGRYANGTTAMFIIDHHGEREAVCTVNMPAVPKDRYHIWIKAWSENEGMPAALVEAGIIELTGDFQAEAIGARLTPQAKAQLDYEMEHV